jgi:putative FmdB family regulatory protein
MPMYEYECTACGHRFERIRKFSDPPIEECPNCGESKVQKLMSSPAIQFKGTGWYITDYAKKSGTGTDPKSGGSTDAKESKDKDSKNASSESKESSESRGSKEFKDSKDSKESKSTTPATGTTTAKASGE